MSDYFTYIPLTPNTVARASDVNSRFTGIEEGFNLLPLASYLFEDRVTYSEDAGIANVYVANPETPITAYNAGLRIRLKAANANTGVSTLDVSGLGVKEILRVDGGSLVAADIVANQILDLTYDGDAFRLTSLSSSQVSGYTAIAATSAAAAAVSADEAEAIAISAAASAVAADASADAAAQGAVDAASHVAATSANAAAAAQSVVDAEAAVATVDNSNFVNLGDAQTLTGIKTFSNGLIVSSHNLTAITAQGWSIVEAAAAGDVRTIIGAAPLASPALTGTPTAPTAASGTNTTQIATTAYVEAAVGAAGGGGAYAPLDSPTFTGTPAGPTAATATNTTQLATTAYVQINLSSYALSSALSSYAPLSSPSLTGSPTTTTATTGDDSTRIASTAWVKNQGYVTSGTYAPLASPAFTGTPTAPTAATATNTTQLATTAYVKGQAYATVASPTFTGTPAAPTAATATNTTQIATTAYVKAQGYISSASPTLTGTVTVPTPATSSNTTVAASTAFVKNWSGTMTGGTITLSGSLSASTGLSAYSDARLKDDVRTIQGALGKVCQMRGVHFTLKSTDSPSSGVIAQEFRRIAPELVSEDDGGMLSVNYGQAIAYLIEAVKELSAKVDAR